VAGKTAELRPASHAAATPAGSSADGAYQALVPELDGGIAAFDTETRAQIGTIASPTSPSSVSPNSVVESPDGRYVYSGNEFGVLRVDTSDDSAEAFGPAMPVVDALAVQGDSLYVTSGNTTYDIVDTTTGKLLQSVSLQPWQFNGDTVTPEAVYGMAVGSGGLYMEIAGKECCTNRQGYDVWLAFVPAGSGTPQCSAPVLLNYTSIPISILSPGMVETAGSDVVASESSGGGARIIVFSSACDGDILEQKGIGTVAYADGGFGISGANLYFVHPLLDEVDEEPLDQPAGSNISPTVVGILPVSGAVWYVDPSPTGGVWAAGTKTGSSYVFYVGGGTHQVATFGGPVGGVVVAPGPGYPVVKSVAPSSGNAAGGTRVTITGENFLGATGVSFALPNGRTADAAVFECPSATTCTATTPDITGLVSQSGLIRANVVVTTPKGSSPFTTHGMFTFTAGMTVEKVVPDEGPLEGGNTITVEGTGLKAATEVCFPSAASGNGPCASVQPGGTDTELTVKAPKPPDPELNPDLVNVEATNGRHVDSPHTPEDHYTYEMSVTYVDPDGGELDGGNTITIDGIGLRAAASFCFASQLTSNKQCTGPHSGGSDTSVQVTVPNRPDSDKNPDLVDVVAVTSGGVSSPKVLNADYIYGFAITKVEPDVGSLDGGNTVTLTGFGFEYASNLCLGQSVGGADVTLHCLAKGLFSVRSDSKITFAVPDGTDLIESSKPTTGQFDLTLSDQKGQRSNAEPYSYAPVITSVTPDSGPPVSLFGGTRDHVVISGTGLDQLTKLCMEWQGENAPTLCLPHGDTGGQQRPGYGWVYHDGSIDVAMPDEEEILPGEPFLPFNFRATAQIDGQESVSPETGSDDYDYDLSIKEVIPDAGPVAGGNTVTIHGQGFRGVDCIDIRGGPGADIRGTRCFLRDEAIDTVSERVIRITMPSEETVNPKAKPGNLFHIELITPDHIQTEDSDNDLYVYGVHGG